MRSACPICQHGNITILYDGPIRTGKFGNLTETPYKIWGCESCDSAWLREAFFDYTQSEYRETVDGESTLEQYHLVHDKDQLRVLQEVGTGSLRGASVIDIGCGGGAFLDLIKGFAGSTVGVEPAGYYHEGLSRKGHLTYASTSEALERWENQLDLAVSFSVLEHVDDPLSFLREAKRLLKKDGRLIISTPNRNDWLLDLLPDAYAPFFYRTAHRWYFTPDSLRALADRAGFTSISVRTRHRFGLANLLLWLRDRQPSGHSGVEVPPLLDQAFIAAMNESERGDYLYADLTVSS
jgi:SAM-dependent methyltransferase